MNSRVLLPMLVSALLLSLGCSSLQFGYNHARWAIVPKLKQVTDFTDAQKSQIDVEFDKYMAWHRRKMLPDYARLLRQAAEGVAEEISPDLLKRQRTAWLDVWEATMRPALPPMAKVLGELDEKQITAMQTHFAEEDADARKDLAKKTKEERVKKRDEQTLDTLDDWAGGLSKAQRTALLPWVHKMPWRDEAWLDERKRMRDDLVTRLRVREPADKVIQAFQSWFVERRRRMDAEGGGAFDAFVRAAGKTLDASQREHLRQKLLGFANDCDELSRQK